MGEPEAIVDPKPILVEECSNSHHCHPFKDKLASCTARFEAGGGRKDESCVEEFFDLMVFCVLI